MRIGILGGSFNPAHRGHLMVAEVALRRLALDQVWLMVSPGNPLKPQQGMAPLTERLASAQAIAYNPRIIATTIEAAFGTIFTRDTLQRLRSAFPRAAFIWLTGADNFAQLHRWHDWRGIMRTIPIAVFPRTEANFAARHGHAAVHFRHGRQPARAARILALNPAPAWIILALREDPISSTAIRAQSPLVNKAGCR